MTSGTMLIPYPATLRRGVIFLLKYDLNRIFSFQDYVNELPQRKTTQVS